jgi:predicted ArsR family transcriptional regulator
VSDHVESSRVELTDPRALRAYAHPIRMALLGLLRREGPKTATEAAAEIGESVASCSFHLRQLARYGLIEEVEGAHGRAKPWRATALYTSWRSDSDDPEVAAAATMLERMILERYFEEARAWLAHREHEPTAWRRAGQGSDYLLYLTAAETRRLTERIDAMTEEFVGRNVDAKLRPKGSRAVRLIHLNFPSTLDSSAETPGATR